MVKKKKILAYFIATLIVIFVIFYILDSLIPNFSEIVGTWWLVIHNFILILLDTFIFIFYYSLPNFFTWFFIIFLIHLGIYVISYLTIKKRRLGGTIFSVFCFISWLITLELSILWGILGLIANPEWIIQWKLIYLVISFPVLILFLFILNLLSDTFSFWKDLIQERRDYKRLQYHVEKKNNVKIIHINTDNTRLNTVFSASIFVLIEEILRKEGDSQAISRFVRSSLTNIISEVATHFNFWPGFKNKLFRFVGVKIGHDCLISQFTRVDGLLPNLITFEDHTAIGVTGNLITHTFIDRGDMRAFLYGPIRICKFARVGANVTITPGITIGEGAVVAAGSLVNGDVPPYTMVGGVPAKIIKKIDPESYRSRIEKDKRPWVRRL